MAHARTFHNAILDLDGKHHSPQANASDSQEVGVEFQFVMEEAIKGSDHPDSIQMGAKRLAYGARDNFVLHLVLSSHPMNTS